MISLMEICSHVLSLQMGVRPRAGSTHYTVKKVTVLNNKKTLIIFI